MFVPMGKYKMSRMVRSRITDFEKGETQVQTAWGFRVFPYNKVKHQERVGQCLGSPTERKAPRWYSLDRLDAAINSKRNP
jgi:hypothetical protein